MAFEVPSNPNQSVSLRFYDFLELDLKVWSRVINSLFSLVWFRAGEGGFCSGQDVLMKDGGKTLKANAPHGKM